MSRPVEGPAVAAALAREPVADVPAALARCQARAEEREGIPMVLGMFDSRSGPAHPLTVDDPAALAEGAVLGGLLQRYADGLAGVHARRRTVEGDTDPTGAADLIDALVVLAEHHLREEP